MEEPAIYPKKLFFPFVFLVLKNAVILDPK